RMPAAGAREPEPTTTRLAAQQDASGDAQPTNQGVPETPQPDREIESWLSDLRGASTPGDGPAQVRQPNAAPPKPSAEQARSGPNPTDLSEERPEEAGDDTTALPVSPPDDNDASAATEKLNTSNNDGPSGEKPRQRRGGGLSAQDLLRRKGRF
ncbi:MAG TPA: hypothetical protein VE197_08125, partial [Mycobacterium sp.]|nr:hypothetical protein [Mycobacterium sp.]